MAAIITTISKTKADRTVILLGYYMRIETGIPDSESAFGFATGSTAPPFCAFPPLSGKRLGIVSSRHGR